MRCLKFGLLMSAGLIMPSSSWAVEIEGVAVPDSVTVAGRNLQLNGAGVRSKFFFNIYVGALYLPSKVTTSEQVLSSSNPKRLVMIFLYDEVGRDKLMDGWIRGFEKNQSIEGMTKLKDRLDTFNTMFVDGHRGDSYTFDLLENGNTTVTFNEENKGVIEGTDFQRALLEVWFGKYPAHEGLKKAMLSGE